MNDTRNIDFTLLNRLPLIHIEGYGQSEKHAILKNYIIPKELRNLGFTCTDVIFNDLAIAYIVARTSDEDTNGIRKAGEVITNILKKINALRCISHVEGKKIFRYQIDNFTLPFNVTTSVIDKFEVLSNNDTASYRQMYM